jgi:glutamate dehydrogenase
MTDEVGLLVLRDNYLQTQALTVADAQAPELLSVHTRCIQILEKSGLLNRTVEYLPDDAEIAERQRLGKGLTRPELAVLLAYAKIWLYHKILDSHLPDDPALQQDVDDYFPKPLRSAYAKDIAQHQLRREIAATVLTNDIVNRNGIRIVLMMTEHGNPESVARAYLLARNAFVLSEVWADIEALDNKVPASVQTRMLLTMQQSVTQVMWRLLSDREALERLQPSIETNRKGLLQLGEWLTKRPSALDPTTRATTDWLSLGVPPDLAQRMTSIPILVTAIDLIGLAAKHTMRVTDMASIFFDFEKRLEINWLSRLGSQSAMQTPWQREATASALTELADNHRRLTAQLASRKAKGKDGGKAQDVASWATHHAAKLASYDAMLVEWRAAGSVDLAMLLLANEKLGALSA